MFHNRIYDQKGAFHIIMVISLLVSNEFETLYSFDNNKERNMLTSIFWLFIQQSNVGGKWRKNFYLHE